MKPFIPLFCLAMLCSCASPPPRLPGQTLVNDAPALRRDALRVVSLYEPTLSSSQGVLRVVDTQIVQAPGHIGVERGTDKVDTMWVERWLIKRDGTNVAYRIIFDAQGSQGTDITVGLDRPEFLNGPTKVYDIK
ncbi:MAG: hypothetical protein KGJ88_11620 [Verrucomicrobiota bacterium]|nr:hypothetical protein [Verrucomicrobiota bacterium]